MSMCLRALHGHSAAGTSRQDGHKSSQNKSKSQKWRKKYIKSSCSPRHYKFILLTLRSIKPNDK